ncbi:MAG: MFS transporter [Pikeienuella sp.]
MLACTGLMLGFGYAMVSQISEPWQLILLFGIFVAAGMSTHDVVTLSTIAKWFAARRGVMTGVVKTGTAIGQVVVPPIAAILIASYGWRTAVITMGAVATILLLVAAFSMAVPPKPVATSQSVEADGVSYFEARRSSTFWKMCAIQFLFFPTLMSIPVHIVVHGMDLGMTAALAATLLSVTGGASIAGRLVIGGFSDRIGGKNAYILCFLPLIASLLAMLSFGAPNALFIILAFYGFAHGGLFTVVSPTVAEFFGTKAHGAIFGVILFCGTIGGAAGPLMAGWVFDTFGSYDIAFGGLAAMAALGLLLTLTLPKRAS